MKVENTVYWFPRSRWERIGLLKYMLYVFWTHGKETRDVKNLRLCPSPHLRCYHTIKAFTPTERECVWSKQWQVVGGWEKKIWKKRGDARTEKQMDVERAGGWMEMSNTDSLEAFKWFGKQLQIVWGKLSQGEKWVWDIIWSCWSWGDEKRDEHIEMVPCIGSYVDVDVSYVDRCCFSKKFVKIFIKFFFWKTVNGSGGFLLIKQTPWYQIF